MNRAGCGRSDEIQRNRIMVQELVSATRGYGLAGNLALAALTR